MNVLAVVAHPDDETLGCGGTLARLAAVGCVVSVKTFTDGVGSRVGATSLDAYERRANFGDALDALGLGYHVRAAHVADKNEFQDERGGGWWHGGGPESIYVDQEMDQSALRFIALDVARAIARFNPEVILTHWPGDLNEDHRRVAEATLVATRPAVSGVVAVYGFETPSSTEWSFQTHAFSPTVFVDLGATHMAQKLNAMDCYACERREPPHPRSPEKLKALAEYRGATIGVRYAEAFVLLRRAVRLGKDTL